MIKLKKLIQEELEELKSVIDIKKLVSQLVSAAQEEYDKWDQTNPDLDELNGGGICQEIAEAFSHILNMNGIDAVTVDSQGVIDQHVWVIAKVKEGIYEVDIPPSIYERGSGYTWKKIPNVVFTESSIYIHRLSSDPNDFENYIQY